MGAVGNERRRKTIVENDLEGLKIRQLKIELPKIEKDKVTMLRIDLDDPKSMIENHDLYSEKGG